MWVKNERRNYDRPFLAYRGGRGLQNDTPVVLSFQPISVFFGFGLLD